MEHAKEFLPVLQILVIAGGFGTLIYKLGVYTEGMKQHLAQIGKSVTDLQSELAEHIKEDREQFKVLAGVVTTQATHGTRLTHLETAGSKR
jgi:hypothetical protein